MNGQELAALSGFPQVTTGPQSELYDYSNNAQVLRNQTLLDYIKGLAQTDLLLLPPPIGALLDAYCPAPQLAGVLDSNTFQLGGPGFASSGGQQSDGMVPLISQCNGQNQFLDLTMSSGYVGSGFVHSEGSVALGFGVVDTSPQAGIVNHVGSELLRLRLSNF
jgi:hypothetical protein